MNPRPFFATLAVFGGITVASAEDRIVSLPPFMVEESTTPPWRYSETPEFQILSQCNDRTTREIAERFHHNRQLLDFILPPQFQAHPAVPPTLLLYDEETMKKNSREEVFRSSTVSWSSKIAGDRGGMWSVSFLGSTTLFDAERTSVIISVPTSGGSDGIPNPFSDQLPNQEPAALTTDWSNLTPGYVGHLVSGNQPPLPSWFASGFLALFEQIGFERKAIQLPPFSWPEGRKGNPLDATSDVRMVRGSKDNIPTSRNGLDNDRLRDFGEVTTDLLPLSVLFAEPRQKGTDVTVWLAESELFLRWVFSRNDQAALWAFLERSQSAPVTEQMFRDCFHSDYATAEADLLQFLRKKAAVASSEIPVPNMTKLGHFEINQASSLQIARVKGGFDSLEASCVRADYPSIVDDYLDSAKRALRKTYQRGDRTPQSVGDLALVELDLGEPEARSLLQEAVKLGAPRPRVYFELARLRYEDALNLDPSGSGLLNEGQRADILEPLAKAERMEPKLAAVYELLGDVWIRSEIKAPTDDYAALMKGQALFPGDTALRYKTAQVLLHHGRTAEALVLLDGGIRDAPNDTARDSFVSLRTEVLRGLPSASAAR